MLNRPANCAQMRRGRRPSVGACCAVWAAQPHFREPAALRFGSSSSWRDRWPTYRLLPGQRCQTPPVSQRGMRQGNPESLRCYRFRCRRRWCASMAPPTAARLRSAPMTPASRGWPASGVAVHHLQAGRACCGLAAAAAQQQPMRTGERVLCFCSRAGFAGDGFEHTASVGMPIGFDISSWYRRLSGTRARYTGAQTVGLWLSVHEQMLLWRLSPSWHNVPVQCSVLWEDPSGEPTTYRAATSCAGLLQCVQSSVARQSWALRLRRLRWQPTRRRSGRAYTPRRHPPRRACCECIEEPRRSVGLCLLSKVWGACGHIRPVGPCKALRPAGPNAEPNAELS